MSYEIIKDYYNLKLFNEDDLQLFVNCGWLTNEQKETILN